MPNEKLKNLKLVADNGKKLPALKVFSEAIKYLKKHFEALLQKTTITTTTTSEKSPLNSDTSQETIGTSVSTGKTETQSKRSDRSFLTFNNSSPIK